MNTKILESIKNFFNKIPRVFTLFKAHDPKKMYGVYKEKSKTVPVINVNKSDISSLFTKLKELIKEKNIDLEKTPCVLIGGNYSKDKRYISSYQLNELKTPQSLIENELLSIQIVNEAILFYLNEDIFISDINSKFKNSNLNIVVDNFKKFNELKPLSSIIIRIPISYFVDKKNNNIEELDDLAEKYKNNLRMIQTSTGLKIPIYFFITEAEDVYGFNRFMSLLTLEERRNFILGWSNHYGMETLYSEEMFDKCFETILDHTRTVVSSKILLKSENIWTSDIFNFPQELKEILKNSKNFINIIFNETSSYKDYFLRGIYLSGSNIEPDNLPLGLEKDEVMQNIIVAKKIAPSSKSADNKQNVFTKNYLFENVLKYKIIPEQNLCSADTYHFLRIRQFSQFIQVTSVFIFVIMGINSIIYFYKLNSKIPEIVTEMDNTSYILIDKNNLLSEYFSNKSKNNSREILFSLNEIDIVFQLLNNSYNINFKNFLIPWSYFSQTSDYFHRYITNIIYIYFVFPTRERIIRKSSNILNITAKLTDGLQKSQENFTKFVKSVEEFEKNILDFNRIEGEFDNENILELMSSVLNYDFTNFRKRYYFSYTKIGSEKKYPSIKLKEFIDPFNKNFENLLDVLTYNIEKDNRIFDVINELIAYIDFPDSKIYEDNYLHYVNELSKLLVMFKELFSFNDTSKIADDFVKSSELLRASYNKYIDKINKAIDKRNKFIVSFQSNVLKELFTAEGDKVKTSKNFDVLSKSISNFQNEPIYAQSYISLNKIFYNENNLPDISDTLKSFKEISQFTRLYYGFIQNGLKNYPTFIQHSLKMAAINTIISRINKDIFIDNKNIYLSNPVNINNIIEVSSNYLVLIDTIKVVKELNSSNTTYVLLNRMFSNSIYKYLRILKDDMISKGFFNYKDNSFDWWNGEMPPAFEGFAVSSAKDLEDFYHVKNEQVSSYITHNVKPLIEILNVLNNGAESYDREYLFWKNTISEIDGKSKANSLAILNDLIFNHLALANKENCFTLFSDFAKHKTNDDYFSNVIQNIYNPAFLRCKAIQFKLFVKDYNEFESFFNMNIAGKFPFSRYLPKRKESELDVNSLFELYQKYSKFNGKYSIDFVKSLSNETNLDDQFNFMDKLKRIFDFFEMNNIKDSEFKGISLNLSINYRPDINLEHMTNSIAEREVQILGNTASNILGNTSIVWKYGSPITIGFRWSKDYNVWPLNTEQSDSLLFLKDINDRKIDFLFQSKWSLFYLYKKFSTDNGKYISQQLTFEIPIYTKNKKDPNVKNNNAVVVIRLTPIKPSNREILMIPSFPIKCPAMNYFMRKQR